MSDKPLEITDELVRRAKIELARKSFFHFCKLATPKFFKDNRSYLVDLAQRLQEFSGDDSKRILVVNLPPRHGKSHSASNLVKWLFGSNPTLKIMTASYNEILSTKFAKYVRNSIAEKKVDTNRIVYSDIFPETKIQIGDASASMWRLEGSNEYNYLATSPKGTATGFGADYLIVDDIVKNPEEAYNENILDDHYSWFTNNMLSRLEGNNWKIILIMTRWAKGDLAGRVIDEFGSQVEVITHKAVVNRKKQEMLCHDVLSYEGYLLKSKKMNADIVEANYNQSPIDVAGQLYPNLNTYQTLPTPDGEVMIYNQTDTADTGKDFLCSANYLVSDGKAYVIDMVYTDEAMETTEALVADLLYRGGVKQAYIESNSGGRGFARNVERIIKQKYGSNRVVIHQVNQSQNKESRILASSGWVSRNVMLPLDWQNRFNLFYREVTAYQKKGKNKHDDGVDVLASIYEQVTNGMIAQVSSLTELGLNRKRFGRHLRYKGLASGANVYSS